MGSSKLLGTAPDQVPTNADLGGMAFQDANAVKITGGDVTANHYVDTAISEVKPSLLLDFANGKTLDPRITFTRSTTATYYDGKTTAKAEENLLNYSQSFDNVWWAKNWSSISYGSGVAPDGTLTASYLREDTSNNTHGISNAGAGMALTANAVYTWSVYAKAGSRNYLALSAYTDSHSVTYFNLATGAIATNPSVNTASITSVGNGWYRCSVTRTVGASGTNGYFSVGAASADNTWSYTGDGVSGIYIWGAQFEQRSGASAYVPTTSSPVTNYIPALQTAGGGAPRFDHDPITGESKGLLIEEQRTNLMLNSQAMAGSGWAATFGGVNSNVTIAPDGTLTAGKLFASTNNSIHFVRQYITKAASAIAYTLSCYIKAAEKDIAWISTYSTSNEEYVARFDLSTGTATPYGSSAAGMVSVGNGWYRCWINCTVSAASTDASLSVFVGDRSQSSYVSNWAGNGTAGLYIWGAQMEAGAFPTSYIPTTSAQVTRSADAASMTGSNFSSWFRADEGTIYAAGVTSAPASSAPSLYSLDDGTSANRFWSGAYVNEHFGGIVGGTVQFNIDAGTVNQFVAYKTAGAYAANDFAAAIDGGQVLTDTSGQVPKVNNLKLGAYWTGGAYGFNGTISRFAYYPKRLSNAELQEMTQ